MDKEITDNIFKWLEILKNRPKMVIASDIIDYAMLRIYIEGYIDGISLIIGKNVGKEITQWYKEKTGIQTSYHWGGHIPFHFKGKSDEELKKILIDTTEDYFLENPDWYKENSTANR